MKRFLCTERLEPGLQIRLSSDESKHATRVMRLDVGSSVLLTDGRGKEAEARIVQIEKSGTLLEVLSVRIAANRPFRLELIQATLKGARMDWIMEKATELGVDAIHAVETQFSVGGDRLERWIRLAQAALKQSGNLRMPEIHEATSLHAVLERLPKEFQGILLSPSASAGLANTIRNFNQSRPRTVILAVGPEGGFSAEEEKSLEEHGFQPCKLSSQILRGETAALTAAAVALHELEFGSSTEL